MILCTQCGSQKVFCVSPVHPKDCGHHQNLVVRRFPPPPPVFVFFWGGGALVFGHHARRKGIITDCWCLEVARACYLHLHPKPPVEQGLKLNVVSSHGVCASGRPGMYKGIISVPYLEGFDTEQTKRLAMLAPNCTVNILRGGAVARKFNLRTPPCVTDFRDVGCKNARCISHPSRFETVVPFFYRRDDRYVCRYCETSHMYGDIWAQ